MDGFAYLSGDEHYDSGPLGRFLPPVPVGVSTAFLSQHTKGGDWVLDPFGASPRLCVEMAARGYRVLVAVNNPVTRFLFEIAASPPPAADLRAALAELAASRKGEERLETHLQSLYQTTCQKCRRVIQAEAFVWERNGKTPIARLYHCPCGESGEFPISEADAIHAQQIAATDGLHRSRALERLAAPNDPERVHAEEALSCYLPRALYALSTIVNKLEGLVLTPEKRRALEALILAACDEANTLWPYPNERPRPKQLTIPPRFLEKNIWRSLELSVEAWAEKAAPVPLAIWPALPREGGGICLFEGPVRGLADHLKSVSPAAVVTALPRPNQAFWTLSALWAGWLWGREAVGPFKSVLHRRRYDWNWHAAALYAALKNLAAHLPLNAPLFALLTEAEPSFLSSAMLAAAGAGFDLHGLALRTRHDPVQIVWYRHAFPSDRKEEVDDELVRKAMLDCIDLHGEPISYFTLHAAALASMASDHTLDWREEALNKLHAPIQSALVSPDFTHFGSSENPELGLWGLTFWDAESDPLPDRIEIALVRYLQKNPRSTQLELEAMLNTEFPGLLTPSIGLIRAVLGSYAVEMGGRFEIRPEDAPSVRSADLETTAGALISIAGQLGYSALRQENPRRVVLWQEGGQVVYAFHLIASAVIGRLLRQNTLPPERCLLVLPGGRAGLLSYKLQRDPSLKSIADRWKIMKFRTLRRLGEMTSISHQVWEKELSGDPIEPPEQMKLF